MDTLVNKLRYTFPDIIFSIGNTFSWSPATKTISYPNNVSEKTVGAWSLLHETGHAQLKHTNYSLDLDLLLMEVQAWEKAKEIGLLTGYNIDENHIQDCLDTYRDWLHKRSTCPRCGLVCLQTTPQKYNCHNCQNIWDVTASRFCRPYRRMNAKNQKKPLQKHNTSSTTFL